MDNSVTPFNFNDTDVRVITRDGEPWFVLADLAKVLGITDVSRLSSRLDDGVRQTHPIEDAMGRTQNTTIVNESGMYEVVIRYDTSAHSLLVLGRRAAKIARDRGITPRRIHSEVFGEVNSLPVDIGDEALGAAL